MVVEGHPSPSRRTATVDGRVVEIPDEPISLLDLVRDVAGATSAKDGCSPQGQCGCCTVLVDGAARVACVTPARRVAGRSVTTFEGLAEERRDRWCDALVATGGTQCGFCTPGIAVRLEAAAEGGADLADRSVVDRQLLAHLCRCTGWQTIREAAAVVADGRAVGLAGRDLEGAARRAAIEGGATQLVGPFIAAGGGGFPADTVPDDALAAVPSGEGGWVVGETVAAARAASGKVQGRRTTRDHLWPVAAPEGAFVATLQTTWTEPAALETDAAWCRPGEAPIGPIVNGGAFGAKVGSPVADAARRLADEHDRPVLAIWSREDTVMHGPKRPPLAAGVRADGSGVVRIVRTPGARPLVEQLLPDWEVEEVDVAGPATSTTLRGAIAVELLALAAAAGRTIDRPGGAHAAATVLDDRIRIEVDAGDPLDETVLRSYVIGAAHAAWSLVTSEALTVDEDGAVLDLTVRSFGLSRAVDTPEFEVVLIPSTEPPVSSQLAVMVAVASAVWEAAGRPDRWPMTDDALRLVAARPEPSL